MPTIFPTQTVRDDSLRWINFFNGRLLTGDDLTQEQAANREARLRLGQALGDGVAWGLWVSANPGETQVTVSEGQAVNRQGQALCLGQTQVLSLASPPKGQGAANTGWFNACGQIRAPGDSGASGLYLLTLGPAEGVEEGLAPVSGLAACNSKYHTEAVQFKLISILRTAFNDLSDPSKRDPLFFRLRNETAYDCLGLDIVNACLETPFSIQPETYGRLDGLRPSPLTDEDVPLAVFFRNADGIRFVDNWSARRRVRLNAHQPTSSWQLFLSDRRTSESEAAFLQFQEQLADLLRDEIAKSGFYAGQRFKYLPPVGLLPTGANGVDWQSFLGRHAPLHETQVDLGLLDHILLKALQGQPITLAAEPYTAGFYSAVDVYRAPDCDFVLFCRSDLGRLQIQFSPPFGMIDPAAINRVEQALSQRENQPATPSGCFTVPAGQGQIARPTSPARELNMPCMLTLHARESNLAVNTWVRPDGVIQSPNLPPGKYRIIGSVNGLAFSRKKIEIIGGQIKLITSSIESLTPENICLDIEGSLLRSELKGGTIRLCLVAGTFADAVEQIDVGTPPWQRMGEIDSSNLEEPLKGRLNLWQKLLKERFPTVEIEAPQLFLNSEYQFPNPARVQSLPEVPQAYAVFGKLGIPLTVINANNPDAPLSSWSLDQTAFRNDADLMAALQRYEIFYLDQLAGAWVQLIVEATSLTSVQSRRLIVQAIRAIQKR